MFSVVNKMWKKNCYIVNKLLRMSSCFRWWKNYNWYASEKVIEKEVDHKLLISVNEIVKC